MILSLLTLLLCCDTLLVEKADVSVTSKVPILVLLVETSAFLLFIFSSLCTLINFHHTFINSKTKNSQGPVTILVSLLSIIKLYITKNSQGPVTCYCCYFFIKVLYITKNSQGPVTLCYSIII